MALKNINELYRWISEMLEGKDDEEPLSLNEVVTKLTLRDMMERQEQEDEADQVQLLTLHASKGLEFLMSLWSVWKKVCCRIKAA